MSKNSIASTIPAGRVRKYQVRHFVLITALPLVVCLLSPIWFIQHPPTIHDVSLLVAMWTLTGGIGISVGFHRLLTHRSFKTYPIVEGLLAVLGSMAGNGPVTYWVAVHRRHHQHSDEDGDPHSPCEAASNCRKMSGLIHAHVGWTINHEIPLPSKYAADLGKKQLIVFVNRAYLAIVVAGILLPAVIYFALTGTAVGFVNGLLYGGFIRIALGNNLIWSVNSICHAFGYRNFETQDSSRNNFPLAFLTFGEAWHNNHHAAPSSSQFGRYWWEKTLDSGFAFVCVLRLTGLAWDVKTTLRDAKLLKSSREAEGDSD